MNTPIPLAAMARCFYGVIPSALATVDVNGIPNVTYVSQIYQLDDRHVAISRQFFNKTSRNLDQTAKAYAELYDPVTLQGYRMKLLFLRSETSGDLFDRMATRIDAIASHTGMKGIFRLIASDVFEVVEAFRVEGFLMAAPPVVDAEDALCGSRGELRGLQLVSDRINRSSDLERLFDGVLESLESAFGFRHTMLLMREGDRLVTVASRGYGESGIGAEVGIGEGLIGTASAEKRTMRVTAVEEGLRYGRAARRSHLSDGMPLTSEIPLPGLPNVQSALVIPLVVESQLLGALAAESADPVAFSDWHEAYLELIGNQVALGISRKMAEGYEDEDVDANVPPTARGKDRMASRGALRRFSFYRDDESVFLDDGYLIRNVPARILWKLLSEWKGTGRSEFTNRELRLDRSLGLPEIRDNLESRLILLRKRLDEKCRDVRIVPTARGRFSLVVEADVELTER